MEKYTLFMAVKKGLLILAAAGICIPAYANGEIQPVSASVGSQLKTSYVCMMNNKYLGTEQIPVAVEGKTYYGCCAGCAASLQNNLQTRQATDPYSGGTVDKADAFIALKSPANQEVLYFKSEENYKKYSESINSQNMSKA